MSEFYQNQGWVLNKQTLREESMGEVVAAGGGGGGLKSGDLNLLQTLTPETARKEWWCEHSSRASSGLSRR